MSAAIARKLWPEARWIRGQGSWATVRGCGSVTVLLHQTEQEARSALRSIHTGGVRDCESRHSLVALHE